MRKPLLNSFLQGPMTGGVGGAGHPITGLSDLTVTFQDAREIWLGKRTGGKTGSGSIMSPFAAGSTSEVADIIAEEAPAGSIVNFVKGSYALDTIEIDKSLTIKAGNDVVFTQVAGALKPLFVLSGATTDFSLEGNFILDHGSAFRDENNGQAITGTCRKFRMVGVTAKDFTNVAYMTATEEVYIAWCEFLYTYGRAGVSAIGPLFQHPCVPITPTTPRLIVVNNHFNGLVDKDFTNVAVGVPDSQKTPADGLVQTHDHEYLLCANNTIRNCCIEGLHFQIVNHPSTLNWVITGNDIEGPEYKRSDFFGGTNPGIKIYNARGAIVSGNTVRNCVHGIQYNFGAFDKANMGTINDNIVTHCLVGIESLNESSEFVRDHNFVWNTSEPVKSSGVGSVVAAMELTGIRASRGHVSNNTLLASEPDWDLEVTIDSRLDTVFTLDDATGIEAGGSLFAYLNEVVYELPVDSVLGNDVTIVEAYADGAAAVTSGTLYYAAVVATPGYTGGITSAFGPVNAHGNTVIEHRYDVQNFLSGSIKVTNHHVYLCQQVPAPSADILRPDAYIKDGVVIQPADAVTHLGDQTFEGEATFEDDVTTENVMVNGAFHTTDTVFLDDALIYFRKLQAANDAGRAIEFLGGAARATSYGKFGFGKHGTGAATVFLNELADSVCLMAENALHLGAGGATNVKFTIAESGGVNVGPTETADPGASNLGVEGVIKVAGTQVLGSQGAPIADATDAPSTMARLNDVITALRTHGVIDT